MLFSGHSRRSPFSAFALCQMKQKAKQNGETFLSPRHSQYLSFCVRKLFRAAFRWLLTTKKFSANINHNCRQLEIHKQLSRQLLSGKSDLFCIFFAFFFFRQPSQKGHEKVSFIRSHENAFNQQINIRTTVARLVSRIIFIFILL